MTIRLEQIRPCLEGLVPSTIATCDSNGVPNVTYVSHVHFVDADHVSLSFQFFNKTRQNILANPQATVVVIHPATAAQYRLSLLYRTTEQSGALFESMKARLAGIASRYGMEGVFRLLGADIYQVLDIEDISIQTLPVPIDREPLIAVRQLLQELTRSADLDSLLDSVLNGLATYFGIQYSLVMLADNNEGKLFTVASRGYTNSGIGSEIPIGFGIIGMAAKVQTTIRIAYAAAEYHYAQAMRQFYGHDQGAGALETDISYPGLQNPGSQIAIPLGYGDTLLGVLYAESETAECFTYQDEDALVSIALVLGRLIATEVDTHSSQAPIRPMAPAIEKQANARQKDPISVRYYTRDGSVFIDQQYLIKGVAGKIFWRLLQHHQEDGRLEFSNRELRLDKSLQLPEVSDNLEARLVLLRKRLAERCPEIAIEKCGRGRFHLVVARPLILGAEEK